MVHKAVERSPERSRRRFGGSSCRRRVRCIAASMVPPLAPPGCSAVPSGAIGVRGKTLRMRRCSPRPAREATDPAGWCLPVGCGAGVDLWACLLLERRVDRSTECGLPRVVSRDEGRRSGRRALRHRVRAAGLHRAPGRSDGSRLHRQHSRRHSRRGRRSTQASEPATRGDCASVGFGRTPGGFDHGAGARARAAAHDR